MSEISDLNLLREPSKRGGFIHHPPIPLEDLEAFAAWADLDPEDPDTEAAYWAAVAEARADIAISYAEEGVA